MTQPRQLPDDFDRDEAYRTQRELRAQGEAAKCMAILTEYTELREPTMEAAAQAARARTAAFGIELIDVRIKRADLPSEVQQSVFARMVAERGRIAKRYRSEGEEEAAKIRAETDKQREILLAHAYERSQRLQGEGDAAATAIYAQAYQHDPRFYTFLRTLEAYDDILTPETLLVLPGDADMFRLLSHLPSAVKPMQGQ
jgi:membrane protease subunit HflC